MSASELGRTRIFADRRQAGRRLGARILALQSGHRPATPVVLALPRGGVPVGFEVQAALNAPLDVLLAGKIGAPGNPELGMGAVAEGGVRVLSEEVLRGVRVSEEDLDRSACAAEAEMRRRVRLYRGERTPIALEGRTAIIVDDGLATGCTACAAMLSARSRGAARVVLATPVGARGTVEALAGKADEVICLLVPEPMWAIGMWYDDFSQVSDHEVLMLLGQARDRAEPLRASPAHGEADSQALASGQAPTSEGLDVPPHRG